MCNILGMPCILWLWHSVRIDVLCTPVHPEVHRLATELQVLLCSIPGHHFCCLLLASASCFPSLLLARNRRTHLDILCPLSAGSITLVMYISLYFLDVEQGLSSRTQWVLGFILLALISGTCLWFLFNIFRRKEVLMALLKSTTVRATRGLAQIRTLVKSDRLRSMITRSTDRSTSSATYRSNPTMTFTRGADAEAG